MPVIIKTTQKLFDGTFISLKTINQLVRNFINYTMKIDIETGSIKRLLYDKDSYSIWFSKDEIDKLIIDNTTASINPTGVRIYFGLHGNSSIEAIELPNRPDDYKKHHTTILVSTYKDPQGENQDLLTEGAFVTLGGAIGMGLDEGSIAPPPYPVPGSLVDPT